MKKRKNFAHFSKEERDVIYKMNSEKKTFRAIGVYLGRGEVAGGSIFLEVKRNRHRFDNVWDSLSWQERSKYAQEAADRRRGKRRKSSKLESNDELRGKVISLVRDEYAGPRDVSYRINELKCGWSISHTTIYRYINKERPDLKKHLRRRGKPCKNRLVPRRYKGKSKRNGIVDRNISERTSVVTQRIQSGHFEGDAVVSGKNGSTCALLTIKELLSLHVWMFKVPDLKAETALAALRGFFSLLPPHLRRTVTMDNGVEFTLIKMLEDLFPGLLTYKCDPYCAYQRGAIENSNGEIRWFFPKGTDFARVPIKEIWRVQDLINNRRRESLDGKSPTQVFSQLQKAPPPKIHLVDSKQIQTCSGQAIEVVSGIELPNKPDLLLGNKFERLVTLHSPQNSSLYALSPGIKDYSFFYS